MPLRSSAPGPCHRLCPDHPAPGAPAARFAPARALIWLLSLPIWLYRLLIAPVLGPRCRFLPTCSAYALEALAVHGPIGGLRLILIRIGRCHPWGGHGWDPVPPATTGPRFGRTTPTERVAHQGDRRGHA
jgi:uncharacterized protein